MNDRLILTTELTFSVSFVAFLFVGEYYMVIVRPIYVLLGIYLRRKLLRDDNLFAQDRLTRHVVLRDSRILK